MCPSGQHAIVCPSLHLLLFKQACETPLSPGPWGEIGARSGRESSSQGAQHPDASFLVLFCPAMSAGLFGPLCCLSLSIAHTHRSTIVGGPTRSSYNSSRHARTALGSNPGCCAFAQSLQGNVEPSKVTPAAGAHVFGSSLLACALRKPRRCSPCASVYCQPALAVGAAWDAARRCLPCHRRRRRTLPAAVMGDWLQMLETKAVLNQLSPGIPLCRPEL